MVDQMMKWEYEPNRSANPEPEISLREITSLAGSGGDGDCRLNIPGGVGSLVLAIYMKYLKQNKSSTRSER